MRKVVLIILDIMMYIVTACAGALLAHRIGTVAAIISIIVIMLIYAVAQWKLQALGDDL
jgi:uncharacterized membrane protein